MFARVARPAVQAQVDTEEKKMEKKHGMTHVESKPNAHEPRLGPQGRPRKARQPSAGHLAAHLFPEEHYLRRV